MGPWNRPPFFEIPHATIYVLLAANIAAFALCLKQSGAAAISTDVLLRNGAMYTFAIDRQEYWRLFTYGFLHANPLHLISNMICLVIWAPHLERRVGSFYLVLIYASALVVGGIVSNITHAGPYLTVGASGALSGIMGALLCLWILGKTDLSANFFVVNLGLNVVLAASASNIDSAAHFGGFAAGVISCALIDLIEKGNSVFLRCKFPEFVKMNLLVLVGVLVAYLWSSKTIAEFMRWERWPLFVVCALAAVLLVKLLDILLSIRKGLAVVTIVLALLNAALVFFVSRAALPTLGAQCAKWNALAAICGNTTFAATTIATCALAVTLLAYSRDLNRGIKDVGFVGASMRGERKRRVGI